MDRGGSELERLRQELRHRAAAPPVFRQDPAVAEGEDAELSWGGNLRGTHKGENRTFRRRWRLRRVQLQDQVEE